LASFDDIVDYHSHHVPLVYLSDLSTCMYDGFADICDPRVCGAKLSCSDPSNPTFQEAMNGNNDNQRIKVKQPEIHILAQQQPWKSVPCPKDKHVLKGTWTSKLMGLSDGTAY
jgi:hypothetical protein